MPKAREDKQANRLANKSNIAADPQHCRAAVLKGLRGFLSKGTPQYHSTARLKERQVEKERDHRPLFEVGNNLCLSTLTLVLF